MKRKLIIQELTIQNMARFEQSAIKHITKIYDYFIGEIREGKKISKYIALKSSCVNNLQVST